VGQNIPVNPHVFSNGHICISILSDEWSPALSVRSVCLSIISMLSSCKEKVIYWVSYKYVLLCKYVNKTYILFLYFIYLILWVVFNPYLFLLFMYSLKFIKLIKHIHLIIKEYPYSIIRKKVIVFLYIN